MALEQPKDIPQSYPIVWKNGEPEMEAFGYVWPPMSDIALHLTCWREGIEGGMSPFRHLLEAHNLTWPEYARTINEWTIRRFKALSSGEKFVTFASGASGAKSIDAARYALLWWWALPEERTVLIGSTTIGALMKRIWAYVTSCLYKAAPKGLPGKVSNSPPPAIRYRREDTLHGIFGVALKEGNAEKTISDLIGIHPEEGLLVIVDESTDVNPAILDAVPNWDKSGHSFQLLLLGNSKSKLDVHGKMSEPVKGWNAVDPDIDEEWRTKRGGLCLYFDCYKSPGVVSPDKALFPFLPTETKIKAEEARLGKDSPQFWRFTRGFWPPDDITKTVLTLSMVETHGARDNAEWAGTWLIKIAALDPAFTSDGDEIILRFATLGPTASGKLALDFGGEKNVLSLSLDARSTEPISYQIVQQAKTECTRRGIEPEYFGMDTWGFGTGAGDILEKEWSPKIHRVVGIGSPSTRFIDSDMSEKAFEQYTDQATEMWFAMRTFVQSGQIKGLDEATIEELCSREYEWKGRKIAIEQKKKYKQRMGKEDGPTGSPDRADAAVILLEVARRMGFSPEAREINLSERDGWERLWELNTGKIKGIVLGTEEEERELSWQTDSIMDSEMSFEDEGII